MAEIRKAFESDIFSAAHVICTAWKIAYAGIVPEKDIEKYTDEGYKSASMLENYNKGLEVYIASENGEDCGVISFERCTRDDFTDCAYIMQLYVLPSYQGKGVGKLLLDFAEKSASGQGYKRVMLNTLEKNAKARRFYERNGYVFFGTEDSPLFSERVVRALYKKEL